MSAQQPKQETVETTETSTEKSTVQKAPEQEVHTETTKKEVKQDQ
jgi:hypothetical protein